ncbi:MAG: hypothetical protein WCP20_03745 [Desulfuromonadales bacterium]
MNKSRVLAVVGVALLLLNLACAATSSASKWVKCSDEGGVCNFSGTRQVRYGKNTTWVVKTFTKSVQCNNGVFGDPLVGTYKECQIQDGAIDATATTNQQPPAPPSNEQVIFSNFNPAAVQSGPTKKIRLHLSSTWRVTHIQNYHYRNNGKRAGTIALQHEDGTMYGPWQAEGSDLGSGVPDAYWIVRPNVEVKPGYYHIIDSSPSTWSYNEQSKDSGMSQIKGFKISR